MISVKYTYAFAKCPVAPSYVSTFVENFSNVIVIIGFHYSAKFRMFRVSHINIFIKGASKCLNILASPFTSQCMLAFD